MRAKDVCSGCASWVEEGWSYCMHCGAARPVRRSSLTLSTLYSNSGTATAAASKEKRSLRRRRQSSEEVVRQLQQVRMPWKAVSLSLWNLRSNLCMELLTVNIEPGRAFFDFLMYFSNPPATTAEHATHTREWYLYDGKKPW